MSGRFPMDLSDGDVADALDTPGLPNFLLDGRKLPTPCGITCCTPWPARAAIKAGWKTDDRELEALVKQVMERGGPEILPPRQTHLHYLKQKAAGKAVQAQLKKEVPHCPKS